MNKIKGSKMPKKYGDFDNLLSSIRMVHYHPNDYANALVKKMNLKGYELKPYDIDLSEHIITNATVILYKFKCFKWATLTMLIGISLIVINQVVVTL
jgi:hypothetical protein